MSHTKDENRLQEIEARLIEQEHRPIVVISNWLVERKKWEKGDPRRDAAVKALIWRLFFSPATMAVAGGTVGLITVALLYWQNQIVLNQNQLIQEQNTFFQEQILRERITANSQVVFARNETFSPARKAVALKDLVVSYRILQPEQKVNLSGAILAGCDFSEWDMSNLIFRDADLRGINFRGANLTNTAFINCNFSPFTVDSWASVPRNQNADFRSSNFAGGLIQSCNLFQVDFSYANFQATVVKPINFSEGESSGIAVNGQYNASPTPLILGAENFMDETKRILQSEYGAIMDTASLRTFVETVEEQVNLGPTDYYFAYFASINTALLKKRLSAFEERKRWSTTDKSD